MSAARCSVGAGDAQQIAALRCNRVPHRVDAARIVQRRDENDRRRDRMEERGQGGRRDGSPHKPQE
jgi:hypothetical protein